MGININDFDKKARNSGAWALFDANKPSRKIHEALGVEEEPILVPVKYIKEGEYLIIAQIGVEGYEGVQKIHKRYANILDIKMGKETMIILNKDKIEYIIEDYDYVEEKQKTKEEVKEEIIATGYITEEEWEKYSNQKSPAGLPIIMRES